MFKFINYLYRLFDIHKLSSPNTLFSPKNSLKIRLLVNYTVFIDSWKILIVWLGWFLKWPIHIYFKWRKTTYKITIMNWNVFILLRVAELFIHKVKPRGCPLLGANKYTHIYQIILKKTDDGGPSLRNYSLKQINNIYTHLYIWYIWVYIYLHQAKDNLFVSLWEKKKLKIAVSFQYTEHSVS